MKNIIKNLNERLFSGKRLEEAYRRRQATQPEEGNRSFIVICLLAMTFVGLVGFLIMAVWVPQDSQNYLGSRNRIALLSDNALQWQASRVYEKTCPTADDCYSYLRKEMAKDGFADANLSEIFAMTNPSPQEPGIVLIRLRIAPESWQKLTDFLTLVVALPQFNFFRADFYLNGMRERTFFLNRPLVVPFQPKTVVGHELSVELILELYPAQKSLKGTTHNDLAFISTQHEYELYQDHLALQRAGRGKWVAIVARIVLALFAVILFLIVDGTPESLGLALFMGFDALSLILHSGWLPFPWLGARGDIALYSFLEQMGSIFRLYFYAQITRIVGKSIKPWMIWGAAISAPIAWIKYYASVRSMTWPNHIWKWNDLVLATICVTLCIAVLVHLRGQRLPWRKAALMIALVGALAPLFNALRAISPAVFDFDNANTLIHILQTNSAYFLALSAFLNISTLENRVKSLSKSHTKAQEMEKEMELGRAMQTSLLRLPELPRGIALAAHYEAARYVSGDTYFAEWDAQGQVLTFLLNDVTGHGIQAALKASACNVIAKTVWSHDRRTQSRSDKASRVSKMAWYDHLTQEFLNERSSIPDINTMIGGEFYMTTGHVAIYRANFTFPILVEPNFNSQNDIDSQIGELWAVKPLALENRKSTLIKLKQGSLLVFISDGFLNSSRQLTLFARYLRSSLARENPQLSADRLKKIILGYESFAGESHIDDRTLLVFQWVLRANEKGAPKLQELDEAV